MNPIIYLHRVVERAPIRLALPKSVLVRQATARDDMSAFVLQDFLKAGFREVEWRYGFEAWQNEKLWQEMGSVCPVCFALDGQRFKIEWLLQNMTHNAPKYTMSHVNCECRLFRINRTEELLDFSDGMSVAPADIDPNLTEAPIDLGEVPEDQRPGLGLPQEQNQWTDIEWVWDPVRNEFVPLETAQKENPGAWVWDEAKNEFVQGELR